MSFKLLYNLHVKFIYQQCFKMDEIERVKKRYVSVKMDQSCPVDLNWRAQNGDFPSVALFSVTEAASEQIPIPLLRSRPPAKP
jgi:hypothetical protein